ncbi:MAG: tyrosine-type recombinase/integrase [Terriglobales bacterium]
MPVSVTTFQPPGGRAEQSAKAAIINRELAILKRSFNLAWKSTPPKMKIVPYIPMMKENNTRTGFLTDEEYSKLAVECAKEELWMRAMPAVAYNYGWRRGELLGLRVRQIDLATRTIRLEVGTTKNKAGRMVMMMQEVGTLLTACIVGKNKNDYVFTREGNQPVKDFRKSWPQYVCGLEAASFVCFDCDLPVVKKKTKCSCGSRKRKYCGLMVHDLRRTGARNLKRLGIAESVAMNHRHQTANVFKRYDMVDESDLAGAAARLDQIFGQTLGIIAENSTKNDAAARQTLTAPVLPN